MRRTVEVDAELLAEAREAVGELDDTELVRRTLVALVQRSASQRLARLGGIEPHLSAPPRRRFGVE